MGAARQVIPSSEPAIGSQTLYVVIPYSNRAQGGGPPLWRAETQSAFTHAGPALRHAETCIGRGGIIGAIVGRQSANVDTGEYPEPEIIGRLGRTPDEAD